MTQDFGAGTVRKVFMMAVLGLVLTGCGGMRLGLGLSSKSEPGRIVTAGSEQAVEIGGVGYVYDFRAAGVPMAPAMVPNPETGALMEQLTPAQGAIGVPILQIGRADGAEMSQDTKGSSLQVASFLCAEHPEWQRGAQAVPGQAAQSYPDWVENGRWNVVRPCG